MGNLILTEEEQKIISLKREQEKMKNEIEKYERITEAKQRAEKLTIDAKKQNEAANKFYSSAPEKIREKYTIVEEGTKRDFSVKEDEEIFCEVVELYFLHKESGKKIEVKNHKVHRGYHSISSTDKGYELYYTDEHYHDRWCKKLESADKLIEEEIAAKKERALKHENEITLTKTAIVKLQQIYPEAVIASDKEWVTYGKKSCTKECVKISFPNKLILKAYPYFSKNSEIEFNTIVNAENMNKEIVITALRNL